MSDQQKFFLLSGQKDFYERSGGAEWQPSEQALMLEQNQKPLISVPGATEANDAWDTAKPMVVDNYGSIGEITADNRAVGFREENERHLTVLQDHSGDPVQVKEGELTDIHFGGESRIAIGKADDDAKEYELGVFHLRKRWLQVVELPEAPIRVWTDAQDTTWALCEKTIYQATGEPLPHKYVLKADRFEPEEINPKAFRITGQITLPEEIEQARAICEDGENIYVLARVVVNAITQQRLFVHPLGLEGDWLALDLPGSITFACDIHPVAPGRIALMIAKAASDSEYKNRDCPILKLTTDNDDNPCLKLVLERYPMLSQGRARFATNHDRELRYIAEDEPVEDESEEKVHTPRRLYPLAQARFFEKARFSLRKIMDSGVADTQWHKIIMEACIPRGCKVRVSVFCTDEIKVGMDKDFLEQHAPLWRPMNSELPFHSGWREPKKDEHGLFEVLLQRPVGEVRELRGRYLQLRLELSGDGRTSPAIHAIRVYYPRLCWQENFLPQHFHQQKPVEEEDQGSANGADVRQRIFASLESMLTPLEDRIGASESLFDPQSAPSAMLPVIANLLGVRSLPEQWPDERKRRLINCAGLLQQRHGTYAGLVLAMDIATDGAVAAGKIVVLENFRFRRTLATILGVSFDDEHHPLTLGSGQSGNSIVGDSLILTKKGAREFLALLSPNSYSDESKEAFDDDKKLVDDFFEKYAHTITILLHGDASRWRANVDEVMHNHAPAHLKWKIKATDHPFILGLAPLLQVDTYLEKAPLPKRVILNQTLLGREGLIKNEPAFGAGV